MNSIPEKGILSEIDGNNLILLVSEPKRHEILYNTLSSPHWIDTKLCYVCLEKTFTDMQDDLTTENIQTKNIVFVDTQSSPDLPIPPSEACVFVPGMKSIDRISEAIKYCISRKGCRSVVIDSINALLREHDCNQILGFTHSLITKKPQKRARKLFLLTDRHKPAIKSLICDLSLFADKSYMIR